MKLTDAKIRRLTEVKNHSDGDSLYLQVTKSGSKIWQYIYNKPDGGRTSKSLGKYPGVSLKQAREKRDALKHGVVSGGLTFGALAKEYFDFHRAGRTAQYTSDNENILKRDFSHLTDMPILDMAKRDLIKGFKNMRARGVKPAIGKAGSLISRIFRYGITMELVEENLMKDIEVSLFIGEHEVKPYAHITDEEVLKALLCAIKTYVGITPNVRAAMEFAVHAFNRPGNIRFMLKADVDLSKRLWTIPAEKMKKRKEYIVPLSPQMVDIIQLMMDSHDSKYVFPSPYSNFKPISENTLNNSLQRLGVCEITAHGLRHTASTFLNESGLFRKDAVERQLAHVDKNVISGTYNKAQYLKERAAMMDWWSNYLDSLSQNCGEA